MKKMMFIYECLDESDKELIDEEIEDYIKDMVLANRGFNYVDAQFHALMYEIIIHGEQVNKFLGESINCFNMKEIVVKARAIKIAYELEQSRPTLELIEFYIGLCKDLDVEPIADILFDARFANRLVGSLSNNRSKLKRGLLREGSKNHVDIQHETIYSKSSKIILFESLVNDFYSDRGENSKLCSGS